eukprot:TRINITY_DN24382_c0_g1_i1.p1 TRINITY_DN24382_c0_g1~~TRINITY_DN24382_c0_g1_i1.p1  ORF type:complete len:922 (+),score=143.85 TRINITY_DN24382_c0_g1_i1:104-2869(+)
MPPTTCGIATDMRGGVYGDIPCAAPWGPPADGGLPDLACRPAPTDWQAAEATAFSVAVAQLCAAVAPTEADRELRDRVLAAVEGVLRDAGGGKVAVIGSVAQGTALRDSDLDLQLEVDGSAGLDSPSEQRDLLRIDPRTALFEKGEAAEVLLEPGVWASCRVEGVRFLPAAGHEYEVTVQRGAPSAARVAAESDLRKRPHVWTLQCLASHLSSSHRGLRVVEFVRGAAVPVLHLLYDLAQRKQALKVDVTVAARSVSGVADRALCRLLGIAPVSVRRALTLVKHWARKRRVVGARDGFPNAVSWALLFVGFCQLQGLLPPLQEVMDDTAHVSQLPEVPAAELGLVVDFFSFLRGEKLGAHRVDVLRGCLVPRERSDADGPLVVIDPVDPQNNMARSTKPWAWANIHAEARRAITLLGGGPGRPDLAALLQDGSDPQGAEHGDAQLLPAGDPAGHKPGPLAAEPEWVQCERGSTESVAADSAIAAAHRRAPPAQPPPAAAESDTVTHPVASAAAGPQEHLAAPQAAPAYQWPPRGRQQRQQPERKPARKKTVMSRREHTIREQHLAPQQPPARYQPAAQQQVGALAQGSQQLAAWGQVPWTVLSRSQHHAVPPTQAELSAAARHSSNAAAVAGTAPVAQPRSTALTSVFSCSSNCVSAEQSTPTKSSSCSLADSPHSSPRSDPAEPVVVATGGDSVSCGGSSWPAPPLERCASAPNGCPNPLLKPQPQQQHAAANVPIMSRAVPPQGTPARASPLYGPRPGPAVRSGFSTEPPQPRAARNKQRREHPLIRAQKWEDKKLRQQQQSQLQKQEAPVATAPGRLTAPGVPADNRQENLRIARELFRAVQRDGELDLEDIRRVVTVMLDMKHDDFRCCIASQHWRRRAVEAALRLAPPRQPRALPAAAPGSVPGPRPGVQPPLYGA